MVLPSAPATVDFPCCSPSGCTDGLITIQTADGPQLTACLGPCCAQTRAEARAERTARAAKSTAFARLPQADDEEW